LALTLANPCLGHEPKVRVAITTMLKTQPGMKEEEKENNNDLWEIGILNLLIVPLHIPFLPRKFKLVEKGVRVLLIFMKGKGKG
jgi:hypothetical protein